MNEMTTEQFQKKLKSRICMLGTTGCFYIIANLLSKWYYSSSNLQKTEYQDFMSGFTSGAAVAIMLTIVFLGAQATAALKNKEKFDKLYVAETDERTTFIKDKCGSRVIIPTAVAIISVAVVIGRFSFIAFITLVCAAIFQLLVCTGIKIYYCKKY